MSDATNPTHYNQRGMQPIVYMMMSMTDSEFIGFLKGNIIKYVSRASYKNGVEDVKKSIVYATWLETFSDKQFIEVDGKTYHKYPPELTKSI